MATIDVKEIKGLTNVDFYPAHYFTESLAADAKTHGIHGQVVKDLRKNLAASTLLIAEKDPSVTDDLQDQVISDWFKALGFYEKAGDQLRNFDFKVDQKDYQVVIERQIPLKGEGQLWIMKGIQNIASDAESSAGRLGGSEHFYQDATLVLSRDREVQLKWKKIVDAIFDADTSACEWLIIHFGNRMILTERGRWQEDHCAYLQVDANELFLVHSDISYQIVEAHFRAASFPIDSAESIVDSLTRNAHKKASEVTKALRDTVRESIEILANEVLQNHAKQPIAYLARYNLKDRSQRQEAATEIFDQSLRFVYRLLFMFFTESQDQRKSSLPVQSRAYQMGYSLERLRDLEGVPFLEKDHHFIHETLNRAFHVYFEGYNRDRKREYDSHTDSLVWKQDALGFSFPQLGSDLFSPARTPIFEAIKLSDGGMQEVLRKLSLARVGQGKGIRTYRVHYAGLGLNQLGAVYEGLLSLKPEILTEKVALLQKEKHSIAYRYVPFSKKAQYTDSLARDDADKVISREAGTFLLTPAGLERKFSASYYTPEVLTRFLAKESVDILLGKEPTLERMESLKICEPAMGSGAFLNAVVDEIAPRMANHYLAQAKARDEEVKEKSHYTARAKDHLMRHCVYGVDLNATAVELAKISLWLNCLHEDGNLPFLDFKLKHGNSLVGCWIKRMPFVLGEKSWPHFLVPNPVSLNPHIQGLLLGDKKKPFLDKDEQDRFKELQRSWAEDLKAADMQGRLDRLKSRIDELYGVYLETRKGYRKELEAAGSSDVKKEIYRKHVENSSAYNQLRLMMDYWCSLWFWPHDALESLPKLGEYVEAMEWMGETELPYDVGAKKNLFSQAGLDGLELVLDVARRNRFFHWDLEFAEIFAEGGFDLVLGNPPWAPVRWEEEDFFEELRPGLHVENVDAKTKHEWYEKELKEDEVVVEYKNSVSRTDGLSMFLRASMTFSFEDRQTNTYRYFFQRFNQLTVDDGIYAIIAQDGILTDQSCLELRELALKEMMMLNRFINHLMLFEEVAHFLEYMIAFHRKGKQTHSFSVIDNLCHVETVRACREESNQAEYRGLKDEKGNFELRGHPKRIVHVDETALKALSKFDNEVSWQQTKLPIIHGQIELKVLEKLAAHPCKMKEMACFYWRKFDETGAPKAGLITKKPCASKSINRACITGPNIFVGNPANKSPNIPWKGKHDFYEIDLEKAPDEFFPDTVYQVTEKGLKSSEYNAMTAWEKKHCDEYRVVSRRMVNMVGSRTLSSAIIPPGPSHINTLISISFEKNAELLSMSALFDSLIFDFLMRSISGGDIVKGIYEITPCLTPEQKSNPLTSALMVRALRLSSISTHYQDLWKSSFQPDFKVVEITSPYAPKLPYSTLTNTWKRDTCIRDPKQREQALCEIDAIVAILFGFDKETLLNLYRSQFGVLQKNLQDLPKQMIDEAKYHFPRYQQMSEAYDQLAITQHKTTTPRKKAAS